MANVMRKRGIENIGEKAVANAIIQSVREKMLRRTIEAEAAFGQLWTLSALGQTDLALREALLDQQAIFHEALVTGTDEQITLHGESLCRGWAKAIVMMQQSGGSEDAQLIGEFGDVIVAIGRSQRAPKHLIERYGDQLTWLRPTEVAAMYMHYRHAQAVKAIWPDAEIIEVREKMDGGEKNRDADVL